MRGELGRESSSCWASTAVVVVVVVVVVDTLRSKKRVGVGIENAGHCELKDGKGNHILAKAGKLTNSECITSLSPNGRVVEATTTL